MCLCLSDCPGSCQAYGHVKQQPVFQNQASLLTCLSTCPHLPTLPVCYALQSSHAILLPEIEARLQSNLKDVAQHILHADGTTTTTNNNNTDGHTFDGARSQDRDQKGRAAASGEGLLGSGEEGGDGDESVKTEKERLAGVVFRRVERAAALERGNVELLHAHRAAAAYQLGGLQKAQVLLCQLVEECMLDSQARLDQVGGWVGWWGASAMKI
jgi:hypothetical protein